MDILWYVYNFIEAKIIKYVDNNCARQDDDKHQRMNENGLLPYDLFS
jgi:hypothetical protein